MKFYKIYFNEEVVNKDLKILPKNIRNRIIKAIRNRLSNFPEKYGVRLRKSLIGLWKLRVGDYRIIFEIQNKNKIIIWAALHRKKVYRIILNRLKSI